MYRSIRYAHWMLTASLLLCSGAAVAANDDKPKEKTEKPAPAKKVTFGDSFRPDSASVFERSALDNASLLHRYANAAETVSGEALLQHLTEVERQLENLKKEYAKLGEELRKQKDLHAEIQAVEQHSEQARQQCNMLEQNLKADTANSEKTREYCDAMCKELKASLEQHYALMRRMGVRRPWYPHGLDPNGPSYDPDQY